MAIVAGAAVVSLAVACVLLYNRLVRLRVNVARAWHNIDVELTRRTDLIPALVKTVKAAGVYEQQTLTQVTQAREQALRAAGASPAARGQVEAVLGQQVQHLLAVAEAYPELTATAGYQDLQQQLEITEDRIAATRGFYNDAVSRYNAACRTFPSVAVAVAARFTPAEFYADAAGD